MNNQRPELSQEEITKRKIEISKKMREDYLAKNPGVELPPPVFAYFQVEEVEATQEETLAQVIHVDFVARRKVA